MNSHLSDLEKKLGDVKFVGGETIPPADAAEVAARAKSADGLLLVWLSGHGGDYATLEKLSFGLEKPAVSFFQPVQRARLDVAPAVEEPASAAPVHNRLE
jgi:hypothetical protein